MFKKCDQTKRLTNNVNIKVTKAVNNTCLVIFLQDFRTSGPGPRSYFTIFVFFHIQPIEPVQIRVERCVADKLIQQIYEDQCLPKMVCLNKVFKPTLSPEQFFKNNLLQREDALGSSSILKMEQRAEYIPCHAAIYKVSERQLSCIPEKSQKKW